MLNQKYYFSKDIEKLTGQNRFTLRRWWEKNQFPKPIQLVNNRLVWPKEVIEQWMINSHD